MTIKVLHVIDSLRRGGAEHQLVNLIKQHRPEQVSSTVVTLVNDLELGEPLRESRVRVHTLELSQTHHWPLGASRLCKHIRDMRPHIIHTWLPDAAIIARTAAALCGHRSVISSVQSPLYSPDLFLDDPSLKWWKLQARRLVDIVTARISNTTYVACSEHVASLTSHALHLSPRRMRVILNSVYIPTTGLARNASEPLSPADPVRLLTVGRLSPQKGHIHLLRALPAIVAEYPHTVLEIAGTGPLEESIRRESRHLSIQDHVTFLGKRDDVSTLLNRTHLFVLPSLWEGLSVVALEALAAGVPMVASDIPPMREIIRDGVDGILVERMNPDPLADAILSLLGDASRRAGMSQSARRRAIERFSVNDAARQFERLYAELLGRRTVALTPGP